MAKLLFLAFVLLVQQDVPYKAKEQFDIKIDYSFKQRPSAEMGTSVYEASSNSERSSTLLPFLALQVSIMDPDAATRVRITNNRNDATSNRKLKPGIVIPIELGFTDDVKDKVNANEYVLTFLDSEKNPVSKIEIKISNEGDFFVNGEKRGKF